MPQYGPIPAGFCCISVQISQRRYRSGRVEAEVLLKGNLHNGKREYRQPGFLLGFQVVPLKGPRRTRPKPGLIGKPHRMVFQEACPQQ